jgi:hypothetical protein
MTCRPATGSAASTWAVIRIRGQMKLLAAPGLASVLNELKVSIVVPDP